MCSESHSIFIVDHSDNIAKLVIDPDLANLQSLLSPSPMFHSFVLHPHFIWYQPNYYDGH